MAEIPNFFRTKPAAAYCGELSPRTLEKLRCSGEGPRFLRPKGRRFVLYERSDLDDWLRSGRRSATTESPDQSAD